MPGLRDGSKRWRKRRVIWFDTTKFTSQQFTVVPTVISTSEPLGFQIDKGAEQTPFSRVNRGWCGRPFDSHDHGQFFVLQRSLRESRVFREQYSGGKLTVTLDGIADTAALAECIDFGDVRSTTPEMIQVVASLAKLPVPPPPLPQDDNNFGLPAGLFPINPAANAAPLDAAAIANLIANLTHWDPQKRGIAVALLGRALPGLSPEQAQLVTAALEIRKDDVDTSVKVSADLLLKNSVVMSSPKTDVARVLITGVTETKAQLALTGQLRSLSGSKNVSAKSENGLLTVELENIKDVEALAKTIRFGMVTKVDAGAREIHVTVSGN